VDAGRRPGERPPAGPELKSQWSVVGGPLRRVLRMSKDKWPRLSQELSDIPPSPAHCRACGVYRDDEKIFGWQEHDDLDRPEQIVVFLCRDCSDRLIDKHPRLYRRLEQDEPFPGNMVLCTDCRHRKGTRCTHPLLKANGGVGLPLRFSAPTRMHIDRRDPKTGRRIGEWLTRWNGPVTCGGKEPHAA